MNQNSENNSNTNNNNNKENKENKENKINKNNVYQKYSNYYKHHNYTKTNSRYIKKQAYLMSQHKNLSIFNQFNNYLHSKLDEDNQNRLSYKALKSMICVYNFIMGYLHRLNFGQILILSFVALILWGAVLLKLPFSTNEPINWLEALFTATSASTVSGLSVVDTGTRYTTFGHLVLMFLMQSGGLGLMSFGVFFAYLTGGHLGLSHRLALREALNQSGRADMGKILLIIIIFSVVTELIGASILAMKWIPELGWQKGLFHSLFYSISAFNNAGFALASDSLMHYSNDPVINLLIPFLYITGGIGFVVLADIHGKRKFHNYSLHSKIILVGYVGLAFGGMLVLFCLEYNNPQTLAPMSLGHKLWSAWFQSTTARTAGFNTIDISQMTQASLFFMMGLMFIGGGTGSTASGIKVSTFMVLLITTRAFLRRSPRPVIFNRSISIKIVMKALAIIIISLFIITMGIFLLVITEKSDFLTLAFDAVSAFGTVGLSRGTISEMTEMGQIILMVLMLIGRLGPLTIAVLLAAPRSESITYPEGELNVG